MWSPPDSWLTNDARDSYRKRRSSRYELTTDRSTTKRVLRAASATKVAAQYWARRVSDALALRTNLRRTQRTISVDAQRVSAGGCRIGRDR